VEFKKGGVSATLKYLEDYYYSPDGLMVFTESYHLKRGYCCKSDCFHCPYDGISIESTDGFDSKNLVKIQCPFCFESFGLPASYTEGEVQSFVYDCEVCCNPIEITLSFDGQTLVSQDATKSN
jgi:hypothetical protein